MSNIRLKTITAEPLQGPLVIQNSYVNITDTTESHNVLSGAMVIDGGVGINSTYDSVSCTSGGALTVGGGLSVYKQTYFGNNVTLDNSSSIFQINGLTDNRLFLDTVINKNFYISPDGINKRLDLNDTNLNINITTFSNNSTFGALTINGGVSISCSKNSENSTNGGALTIAGGLAVGSDAYISQSLIVGESYNEEAGLIVKYTDNSQIVLHNSSESESANFSMDGNDLHLSAPDGNFNFYTTSGNFEFQNGSTGNSLLTISGTNSLFSKYVLISDIIESLSSTIGALVVNGGVSVSCTTEAVSSTSGGGLTVAGGVGISKNLFTGDTISIDISNGDSKNKLMLYQENEEIVEDNLFTGIGTIGGGDSIGSLVYQVTSVSADHIFYAGVDESSSNEVFRIKGTNEVQFTGDSQKYSILGGGSTSSSLSLQGQNSDTETSFNLYSKDGDTTDDVNFKIYGYGLPNDSENSESLSMGWDANNDVYYISVDSTGTGQARDLAINGGIDGQLQLLSDGSIKIESSIDSSNSSTGALVLQNGGLSINCTSNATNVSSGGALTVYGGASFGKDVYIADNLILNGVGENIVMNSLNNNDLLVSTPDSIVNLAGADISSTYASDLSLYTLNNNTSGNYEILHIYCDNTSGSGVFNINTNSGGDGILRPLQLNVGMEDPAIPQLFLATSGNVGINTSSPEYNLDVNGTFNVSDTSSLNGLVIYNTEGVVNGSTASFIVYGGAIIEKELVTNDTVLFQDTAVSLNSTTASVVLSGGLSISSTADSSSITSGGALTVAGGASIAGNLFVGNITYADPSAVGNTFASLALISTEPSLSTSVGSLVSLGGISIQTTYNATSVTSGGGLTIAGGVGIAQDLYIGNSQYQYGITNYYTGTSSNLLNFYDSSNIERFSVDLNTISNDFSISRYNSLGFVEKSIEISNANGSTKFNNITPSTDESTAAIIALGGISIDCTTDAVSLGNGGGLTVFGGASISKKLFVGGDTVFSSTTPSTNSSNGSVTFMGGVGIGSDLNVAGNTIISGDLTVVGNTTIIESSNTVLDDNILVLNSGPAGSADAGFLVQRYQYDNDVATGDTVADVPYETNVLPNQSGMTSTQIKLSTLANSSDDYYNGWWIKVTSGFSVSQVRKILDYNGSTRVATISSDWTGQNPAIGDTLSLYNKPYVGIVYNEINDRFEFGATTQDPGRSFVHITDNIPIYFSSAQSVSKEPSDNSTMGGIVTLGGIGIACTKDATSRTSGGALTVAGGASIEKTLYAGQDIYVNGVKMTPNTGDVPSTVTFNASNNVSVPEDVVGLAFDSNVWGFDIYLAVRILANTNMYSNYHIRGTNKDGSWEIVSSYVGDQSVNFTITNGGQLQYTTPNYSGFLSAIFKYKVITN
jgi:hypothetical protein